jgi:hypothetical protein
MFNQARVRGSHAAEPSDDVLHIHIPACQCASSRLGRYAAARSSTYGRTSRASELTATRTARAHGHERGAAQWRVTCLARCSALGDFLRSNEEPQISRRCLWLVCFSFSLLFAKGVLTVYSLEYTV